MKVITEETLIELIKIHGFDNFLKDLMATLKKDFSRWHEFNIIPRPAMYVPDGVLELMPICVRIYMRLSTSTVILKTLLVVR